MNENFYNIPIELRNIPHWVCWAWEDRNGKMSKVPKNSRTGGNAGSTYPDTWGTFETALEAYNRFGFNGIGWVFTKDSGYFGVDIDHCTDNIALCNEFVETLKSYNEISTSGTGLHIICKGVLPEGKKKHNSVEMYSHGRYFIFTGNIYNKKYSKIVNCSESIKPLHKKYLPETSVKNHNDKKNININNEININDYELLQMAMFSKNGVLFSLLYNGSWEGLYPSHSNADMALCCMLAFWTSCNESQMDRLFRGSRLMRSKWDEKHGLMTYGQMTIKKAIDNCLDVYHPEDANPFTKIAET